jgi:hypothetical protein
MTHALTRILGRSKGKHEPDYLPPYFWHRFAVWMCLGITLNVFAVSTLERVWDGYTFVWGLLFALLIQMPFFGQAERRRRRWTQRVLTELETKLNDWPQEPSTGAYEAGEAFVKMQWLAQELRVYNAYPLRRYTLSVRLTPWEGNGTRFTVYERKRSKRVYTFYHE